MAMIFYAIMDSDSKLPSEDNVPSFFPMMIKALENHLIKKMMK